MALLIITDGPEKGKTFSLGQAALVMIGRDPSCTMQILDPKMSRVHLQIKQSGASGHSVIDFESANGVFVNGFRISGETQLASEDEIRVGETTIAYSMNDDPQAMSNQDLLLRKMQQGAIPTQLNP